MKKNVFVFIVGCFFSLTVSAENIKSLTLHYDELEKSAGVQNMRYLINQQFMRIDNGDDKADYILFDVSKKIIYSINHDDQTILKIDYKNWTQPEFDFKVSVNQEQLKNSPKIQNKTVFIYEVKAADEICTSVYLIKNIYEAEMKVMYQYQQILSGQQVVTLNNTPKEMQTPCFLVDQVYHSGEYFKIGLPVKINYSRDYAKFLKDFKYTDADVMLFRLPKNYQEYKAFGAE